MEDSLNDWFKTPKGQQALDEFITSLDIIDKLTQKYIHEVLEYLSMLTNEEIDETLNKVFQHDNKLKQRCKELKLRKPSNILSYILDTWIEMGEEVKLPESNCTGAKYKNYTFTLICEDDCFIRVYKDNEIIYQTN